MKKNFSIATKVIRTDKLLLLEIRKFCEENGYSPHIFMNKETSHALSAARADIRNIGSFIPNLEGFVGEYSGLKVYEDNDLEFGEVELR